MKSTNQTSFLPVVHAKSAKARHGRKCVLQQDLCGPWRNHGDLCVNRCIAWIPAFAGMTNKGKGNGNAENQGNLENIDSIHLCEYYQYLI